MQLDCRRESAIHDPCNVLPEDLNQTDAAEVVVPLWDHDDGPTSALLFKVAPE